MRSHGDLISVNYLVGRARFEAYRELGYQLTDRAVTALMEASGEWEDEGAAGEVEVRRELWGTLNASS